MFVRVGAAARAERRQLFIARGGDAGEDLCPLGFISGEPATARTFDRNSCRQALTMSDDRPVCAPSFHKRARKTLVAARLREYARVCEQRRLRLIGYETKIMHAIGVERFRARAGKRELQP